MLSSHFAPERRLAQITPGPARRRQRANGPRLYSSVHYGEPWLDYEVSQPRNRPGLELGFHCESRDKGLNRYLLLGFRHHLFEIKDTLGGSSKAEMWDRGWTKIYEVYPEGELNDEYQQALATRFVEITVCLHPIFVDLRNEVARVHR